MHVQTREYVLLYIELNMHRTIIVHQANQTADYGPEKSIIKGLIYLTGKTGCCCWMVQLNIGCEIEEQMYQNSCPDLHMQ